MSINPSIVVSCSANNIQLRPNARDLATSLKLKFIDKLDDLCHEQFVLFLSNKGLELKNREKANKKWSSLFVDFSKGPIGYRLKHDLTIHQPLARAVGIKAGFRPEILDATAGMGCDAFLLGCLGCTVTMVERSPIIGALLKNGLERGKKENHLCKLTHDRIMLVIDDAIQYMRNSKVQPYTIYLDPMYPHSRKHALNKIEMRIIRQLVGSDDDSPILLRRAIQTATNRVVVKRPKGAATIDQVKPTYTISMKNSRFDIYLVGSLSNHRS